jgi:broad-specificity NMP kinase
MPIQELNNTIIVLIGFAGTGKYTIARELCDLTEAKLIDNHLINNPVFSVVEQDGIKPLHEGVWDKVKAVRKIVYESIRELSPPQMSFVFTIELFETDPGDQRAFIDLEELAAARRGLFVPVRLICELEELCRRIVDPARAQKLKLRNPEAARRKAARESVLDSTHPHVLTIDVTSKTATEAAEIILRHVEEIRAVR